MKRKYMIGFFSTLCFLFCLLTAGYQISYRRAVDRQAGNTQKLQTAESLPAEGEAVKEEETQEEGYYICELNGYAAVYLSDRTTLYELTDIPVSDLPDEIRNSLSEGKYAATEEELYAFLENYSS